jgi:hypothetical protein
VELQRLLLDLLLLLQESLLMKLLVMLHYLDSRVLCLVLRLKYPLILSLYLLLIQHAGHASLSGIQHGTLCLRGRCLHLPLQLCMTIGS